ncbi:FAD-dependent oxidoreductase [Tichowtungia aerotolerans]|uniref:FAD-dependent oxidoreductase n=1 Tax=Tichowtungia aerotolerans TaxID=2697043 RepID=A0A6P1M8T3_9BACT|nr:FAD-dependent oxidoreductase [Tichowtungia aerotolerans]QHI67986.1 FAD-dependent oxidoreductase [Tichowtungia aerotolerans]
MLNRRDFVKTGTLGLTCLAGSGWAVSFDPSEIQGGEFNHSIPFRKKPRNVLEVIPGFLWADAADFQHYGGWALDTQHVGFMGSSYLIAHGTSKTVTDATLKLKAVKPGKYRLWVRSRNWIPEHAPGTFGIAVNGRDSGCTFGAQQEKGWVWQDGGVYELAGSALLALQDKTGQFGRCSSILLTRDLNYRPPVDVNAFTNERARLTGVTNAIKRGGRYDTIVVGAGPAGVPAAIAAARMGAKTALVSSRPVLGGNASAEIGVPVQGAARKHSGKPVRETGIIEEAGRLELHRMTEDQLTRQKLCILMSRPFKTLVEEEPLLELHENWWLEGVKKEGDRITEVILVDTLTGERKSLAGKMFIDCTGDAWLGHHAGADERVGREAYSEYKEDGAPTVADGNTMSACLRGGSRDMNRCFFHKCAEHSTPQTYTPPPWLYDLPEGWLFGRVVGGSEESQRKRLTSWALGGTWWYEHPGIVDDLWDPEFARDELFRVNYTLWDYFKNHWSERKRLANYSLEYIPFMAGKRESRRLMGDLVLTANDAIENRQFDDAIAHTGWTLDVHHHRGILSTEGLFTIDTHIPIGQIPYRSLYSRNIENLLMAGRCASVTHLALGTVRIEASCAATGQAAGTAAALALYRGTTPRGVYQKHMTELQQLLLKNDQYVPGILNRDPADLARTAHVRASSTRELMSEVNTENDRWLPLSVERGEFFAWEAGEKLESIQLYLEAKRGGTITMHLREANAEGDLSSVRNVATVSHSIPAGTAGWVEIPVKTVLNSSYAWVVLDRTVDVQWRSGDVGRAGSFRIYNGASKWEKVDGSSMHARFSPNVGIEELWAADNVINGIARPTLDGKTNTWESDPKQALPQSIELVLENPSKVGAVQCVFDTDLTVSMPMQRYNRLPKECVRDYTLECRVNGQWQSVARVSDNFQRFRRHSFKPVVADKVRLTVNATHGGKTARVIELRVYPDAAPFFEV